MSEVMRYVTHRENIAPWNACFPPNEAQRVLVLASDYDALLAERDALLAAITGWTGYGWKDGVYHDSLHTYFASFTSRDSEKQT